MKSAKDYVGKRPTDQTLVSPPVPVSPFYLRAILNVCVCVVIAQGAGGGVGSLTDPQTIPAWPDGVYFCSAPPSVYFHQGMNFFSDRPPMLF